ncbi:MAG: hypothetical protein WA277_06490 [Nitrospirota bacterium]
MVNYAKIQNKKDTTHDILMVSDNIIDIVESNYNYTAEGAYYGTTSNMANFDFSWSEASDPCRSRGVTSSSPNEITLTYQSESNNQIGAINVLNYDNFNGDTTWMILYEKDESLIYSTLNATETYRVIYGEPPGWITGPHLVGDPLVVEDRQNKSSRVVKYVLAYKTSNSDIKKIILEEISISSGKYPDLLTGFSCQLNGEMITYTYITKKWDGSGYVFDKRVVGIINAADRQEFTISSVNFPMENFNFTQLVGIGIHKIQVK